VPTHFEAPGSLAEYFATGPYKDEATRFGTRLTDATFVANHLKRVVGDTIAKEAELSGGKNVEVGTAVEVATITARGARLIA
jgi:hypothetical protein